MKKTHGTRYTYVKGCRCEDCRKANSNYMRQYYHGRPKLPAQRNNRAWNPWEDTLVSDYTKSARQIATMLERTAPAVANRRRALLARRKNQESETQR